MTSTIRFHFLALCAISFSALMGASDEALAESRFEVSPDDTVLAANEVLQKSRIIQDLDQALQRLSLQPAWQLVVGPYSTLSFNATESTLEIPQSLLSDSMQAQQILLESRDEILPQALNMLEYMLYHEAAHGLLGLPSEEDDAEVEEAAAWLMMTSWPNGAEQLLDNMTAFAAASQKLDGPLTDYWHAHALYERAQEHLACLALGNDPTLEARFKAVLEPEARVTRCQKQWQALSGAPPNFQHAQSR